MYVLRHYRGRCGLMWDSYGHTGKKRHMSLLCGYGSWRSRSFWPAGRVSGDVGSVPNQHPRVLLGMQNGSNLLMNNGCRP